MKFLANCENDQCIPNDIDYGKHTDKVKKLPNIYEGIQSNVHCKS